MLLQHNFLIGIDSVETFLSSNHHATKDFLTFFLDCFSLQQSEIEDIGPLGYKNQPIFDKLRIRYNYSNFNLSSQNLENKIYHYSLEFFDYGLSSLQNNSIPLDQIFIALKDVIEIDRTNLLNLGDELEDIFASIVHHLVGQSLTGISLTFKDSKTFFQDNVEHLKETYLLTIESNYFLDIDLDNLVIPN